MVVDPMLAQPQTLASSEPDAVFRQLLDEINPELAHIPLQFIQVQLAECFKPMIRGLSSVDRAALEDTSPYGPMGTIKLIDTNPSGNDDISSIHPTHLLAISSRGDAQSRPRLVPVHGIVFVAHCAKPRLGASAVVEGSEPNTFVLHQENLPKVFWVFEVFGEDLKDLKDPKDLEDLGLWEDLDLELTKTQRSSQRLPESLRRPLGLW